LILVLVFVLVLVLVLVLILVLVLVLILILILAIAVVVLDGDRGRAARGAAAEEAAAEETAAEAKAATGASADDDRNRTGAAAKGDGWGRRRRNEHGRNDRARRHRPTGSGAAHGAADLAARYAALRGAAADNSAFHGSDPGLGLGNDSRTGRRIGGQLNGAPADDRAAAGASAEFRQSHSYRHDQHPVPGRFSFREKFCVLHVSR